MKIFLKKINLSTVDSRYYSSFWRCYWSWRSETRGFWNCWCLDRFCSKWPITERPQIKWQYPWLYLPSILKTISIIDLTTPPLKFPSYFNLHNESIFLIFFKIIFNIIIIIFAPSCNNWVFWIWFWWRWVRWQLTIFIQEETCNLRNQGN